MGLLGGLLERLEGFLGPLGGVLGALWALLGSSWGGLGATWTVLETSWGVLWSSWGVLGASGAENGNEIRWYWRDARGSLGEEFDLVYLNTPYSRGKPRGRRIAQAPLPPAPVYR